MANFGSSLKDKTGLDQVMPQDLGEIGIPLVVVGKRIVAYGACATSDIPSRPDFRYETILRVTQSRISARPRRRKSNLTYDGLICALRKVGEVIKENKIAAKLGIQSRCRVKGVQVIETKVLGIDIQISNISRKAC